MKDCRAEMRRVRGFATGMAVCLAVGLLACGEKEEPTSFPRPEETADPLPPLPAGWKVQTNETQGFAFGLPRGWTAKVQRAGATRAVPADRAVAVSISADRTDEALAPPLRRYAPAVLRSLSGLRLLSAPKVTAFGGIYDGVVAGAAATAERAAGGGRSLRQRLRVYALRRPGVATLTILVARRSSVRADAHDAEVERLVRSVRLRPVGSG